MVIFQARIFVASMLCLLGMSSAIGDVDIEEVSVIATRSEAPVSSLPGNVSLLDGEQLALSGVNHIQQILNTLPGVSLQRGSGQESLPSIRSAVLTGAGACGSVLVMEEAIPVRGVGFCNVNELFDTHYELANSISVVRGANSAFFGSNALTGSVNVHLPATGEDRLSVEFGANEYVRGKAALSYGKASDDENSYGRVYTTLTRDGGYRDDAGFDQQKLSWRQISTLENWKLHSGFTATHLNQQTAGFIVGRDSYRDENLAKQNLDPEAFRKTSGLRAWVRADKKISDQRRLTLTPYLRVTDMDFLQHFLPGDPLEENQQVGLGFQSSVSTESSDSFQWTVGLDADISDGALKQTQENPTQGSAFLQETIPSGTHYDYDVSAAQLGVFIHTDWEFAQHWRTISGLRWETLRYEYDNQSLTGRTRDDGSECGFGGCRYSRPADRSDNFSHLSPKFELHYLPNDNWRFKASLANSFRSPQATELYRLQRAQSVADLDNVRATHVDAGIRWQGAAAFFEASAYHIKQKNVIVRDSDFFTVDGARTKSTGLEVATKIDLNEDWSFNTAANFVNHRYDSDFISGDSNVNGNQVDTAPKHYGSASLTWQATTRILAELETLYVGEYFLEPENLRRYPGHTITNLRLRYEFSDRVSSVVRLINAGDRRYAERADFTSFTDERYFPGEPRSIFVQLIMRI